MSETMTTDTSAGSDPSVGQVPEGFVPAAEVENAREEARRRYQGENDKLKAELSRLQSSVKPAASDSSAAKDGGFDPDAFRRQLLSDVYGATSLSVASEKVRAEFPHADPALFTPDGLSQFTTPEALRFAAQDSHSRVAAILDAERATLESTIREEFAAKYGQAPGPAGTPATPSGDPTPAQLAAMSVSELNALEASNPGVMERVLAKAQASGV